MPHYTFKPFIISSLTPNKYGNYCARKDSNKGTCSPTPLPRSGHRMICIGSNLYAFGGYNQFIEQSEYNDEAWVENCPLFKELWKFNTISKSWTRLKNLIGMPGELASHSAVACDSYMIVYGGTATPFGEASSNSIYLCQLPKGTWIKLSPEERTGNMPAPMYGQAVWREKENLFVVGGTTGFQYSIDVHVFDLNTCTWKYLVPDSYQRQFTPHERYRHEIVFHNDRLFVFGGGTSTKAFPLDIIPVFDIKAQVWRSVETYRDRSTQTFPKPRKCHVLVKYKMCVYIQGGTNEGEHLNDFWRLDLRTMVWCKLKGETKKPIYFHSGAVTEEGTIYFFGGIWKEETTRTNKMFKVHVDIPSLLTLAWEAVDYYAPNLVKLPRSKLLEMGIPPLIVKALKGVPDVG